MIFNYFSLKKCLLSFQTLIQNYVLLVLTRGKIHLFHIFIAIFSSFFRSGYW